MLAHLGEAELRAGADTYLTLHADRTELVDHASTPPATATITRRSRPDPAVPRPSELSTLRLPEGGLTGTPDR